MRKTIKQTIVERKKTIAFLTIYLFLMFPVTHQASASVTNTDKDSNSINKQTDDSMKTTLLIAMTLGSLLGFALQTTVAQELSYNASSDKTTIYLVKKDIEQGNNLAWQYDYVKRAISKELRKEYYDKNNYTPFERKTLDPLFDDLAKVSAQYNINLETIEESQFFASYPGWQQLFDETNQVYGAVLNYDPKTMAYIVAKARDKWLLYAVSNQARTEWAAELFKSSPDVQALFFKKLDNIAVAAKKAVPKFKPGTNLFANHNPAEEALMKKQLKDISKIKIHNIGLVDADWQIQWDETKIVKTPAKRFKVGYIYGKNANDDFDYCRLYQVNVIQDYQGGNKYGATYGVYIDTWIMGCPQ
jgi:hypothetical protein